LKKATFHIKDLIDDKTKSENSNEENKNKLGIESINNIKNK